MRIDISRLTEEELIDLNRRIVQRLRMVRDEKAQGAMQKFALGDRVMFPGHGAETVYGVLTKYNRKSVTVISDAGQRWNVAPGVLKRAPVLHVNAEGKIEERK